VKKMVVIIALLMLVKPVIPVAEYIINYDYISKVLCVNKEKPIMHCNGKCHLMQELAKASESEKPASSDKKTSQQQSEILFFQEIPTFTITTTAFNTARKISSSYSNLYTHLNDSAIFHPPVFIS